MWILKKIVSKNRSDWDEKLDSTLWSFRTAYKVATGMTPFKLVYGVETVVPMEYVISSLRIAVQHRMSPEESVLHRQQELLKLEEDRILSAYVVEVGQQRRKSWMTRQVKFKIFQKDDWVMVYNSKLGSHLGKLKAEELGQGTFRLRDVFGTMIPKPVNGFKLKKFYGKVPEIPRWMFSKAEDIVVRSIQVDLVDIDVSLGVIVVRATSSDQGQSEIGSDGGFFYGKQMMVHDSVCQAF